MPVVFLVGDSQLKKEELVDSYKKSFGGEYVKVHPEDVDKLEVIKSMIVNLGMFGGRKIIDVLDYDSWKSKEKKEFESIIKGNIPEDVLIVVRAKKGVKGFKTEKCDLPKPWEREKWHKLLSEMFRKKGLEASDEIVEMFLDLVGMDELRLENELEKLRLYKGKDKVVNADDVESVVFKSTSVGIDELAFAISEMEYEKAHRLVKDVLKSSDKVLVSASLAKHFIDLFRTRVAASVKDKYTWPDVSNYSKALGVPVPKMARFLGFKFKGWKNRPFNHIKVYSKEKLSSILKELFVMDRSIKFGNDPEVSIHEFIESIRSDQDV